MKRTLVLFIVILTLSGLSAIRNWQAYTNTTHIYDMLHIDNKIYLTTWGGLEIYDLDTNQFTRTYTIVDGLQDLDIKSIAFSEHTETLLLGTDKSGINRLQNGQFLLPINDVLGLPANSINELVVSDSLIYVATNQGLTILKDVESFPYPLPINHYATHNGLSSNRVSSVALTDDGYLICGTDNGLNYVHTSTITDPTTWQHFLVNNSPLPDNRITDISVTSNVYAVSTRNGILRINDINDYAEWTLFNNTTYPDNIVSGEILTVFIDSSYNIWYSYGIWNENLLYIEYPAYDTNFPAQNPAIYAIIKISPEDEFTVWQSSAQSGITTSSIKGFKEINNTIYAYTWGFGFFYYEDGFWHNRESNCIVAPNISDIDVDKGNRVWITNGSVGSGIKRKGTRGVSSFDGFEWHNFQKESTPLRSNNVFRVAIDAKNRKWFGSWETGVSVYDESASAWYHINRDNGLTYNMIGEISIDSQNNIWVSNHNGGVYIFDIDAIETTGNIPSLTSFDIFDPIVYSDVISLHHTTDKTFFGCFYSGIRYWDDTSFPQDPQPGDYWRKPPPSQLWSTYIYGIDSRQTYFGEEVWIAAENGLYMYDTYSNKWYRYTTTIKREYWFNNNWQRALEFMPDVKWYFEGEERLYGAAPTIPTAMLVDPFDRIWIGTETNGLTVYDLTTDRFSVINMNNAPLLSNKITALAYEPYSGNLYIGTDEGLVSVEIGRLYKDTAISLRSTIAYPNPFKPDHGQTLIIANANNDIMPEGKNQCRIYNKSGDLIITLEEDRFFKFSWDGRNSNGNKCSSGVYFYVVSSANGDTDRGTIVLIR